MKNIRKFLLLLMTLNFAEAKESTGGDRLNIAVVANSADLYGKALSELTKLDYLNVVERRDLQPLLKELELSQQGVITKSLEQKLQGSEFLVILEGVQTTNLRIVRVFDGKVTDATSGSIKDVLTSAAQHLDFLSGMKQLALLKSDEKNFFLKIGTASGKYRIGDQFGFYLDSKSDGYLYLLTVTNQGDIEAVIPGPALQFFQIKAGHSYSFPEDFTPDGKSKLSVTGPAGKVVIKAIVSKRRFEIGNAKLITSDGRITKGSATKFTKGLRLQLSSIPRTDWGVAEAAYEVIEK